MNGSPAPARPRRGSGISIRNLPRPSHIVIKPVSPSHGNVVDNRYTPKIVNDSIGCGSVEDEERRRYQISFVDLTFFDRKIEDEFRLQHTRSHCSSGAWLLFLLGSVLKPVYVLYLIVQDKARSHEDNAHHAASASNPADFGSFCWEFLLPLAAGTWVVTALLLWRKRWLCRGNNWQWVVSCYWLCYYTLVEYQRRHSQRYQQAHVGYVARAGADAISLTQEVYYLQSGIMTVWLLAVVASAGLRFPFAVGVTTAVSAWLVAVVATPGLHYNHGGEAFLLWTSSWEYVFYIAIAVGLCCINRMNELHARRHFVHKHYLTERGIKLRMDLVRERDPLPIENIRSWFFATRARRESDTHSSSSSSSSSSSRTTHNSMFVLNDLESQRTSSTSNTSSRSSGGTMDFINPAAEFAPSQSLPRPFTQTQTQQSQHHQQPQEQQSPPALAPVAAAASGAAALTRASTAIVDGSPGGRPSAGDFTLDASQLELGARIASGGGGTVYRGRFMGTDVAVKESHKQIAQAEMLEEIAKEASFLAKLRSPFIIRFHGLALGPTNTVYLVEELCACSLDAVAVLPYGGHQHAAAIGAGASADDDDDDQQQQQRRRRPQLTALQRVTVARQVATAMQYSHSKGIAHRDLKLANILLDRDNTAKLCDFGIARHVTARHSSSNNVSMTGGVGTPEYTAPELISTCAHGRAEGGLAMDVYAFGMVLWALQARCVPWHHDPAQRLTRWQIETKVVAGERPPMPAGTSPAMVALIRRCWAQRPEDRPEFGTVCAALETIEAQVHQAQLAGADASAAAAPPTPKDELPEALAKVCSESVDP